MAASSQSSTLNAQHSIREGALFVADAHYPHHGDEFLQLLIALEEGRTQTPQLFLMGDIFDLLFGCGAYIRSFAAEAITRLNRLSEQIEIHYFEGNHDFCLSNIFPNINIVPRTRQPVAMELADRKVMLAHGDRYDAGWGYGLYSFFLRQCRAMCLLLPWERKLVDSQIRRLARKNICHNFKGFDAKVFRILRHYPPEAELVIEGHFHQGRQIGRYLSLPSLACQKELGVVRGGEIVFAGITSLPEEGRA